MKTTPLYDRHVTFGAQMTEFAGYQMPVRYVGDKQEHLSVREKAGLFDVSHMGEVWVQGPNAEIEMARLLNQDLIKRVAGQAFYGVLLNDQDGIVDDVITYKFSSEKFLICVNASNRNKDFEWIRAHCNCEVTDVSDDWAQVAIQGPMACEIAAEVLGAEVLEIKRFRFIEHRGMIVARTGYTGEDGFEIFGPNSQMGELWDALAQHAMPCGLAARDTLRLEAGMCLYGHEINDQTTPWEAGLGNYVHREGAIPKKRLLGLVMESNAIARADYEVCDAEGKKIGWITSGTKTPYLNQAIAMAYVEAPYCEAPSSVFVKIRGRLEPARVCQLPFYRRKT